MGLRQGMLLRRLQPFRVLVEHGIDDVNEGLIAGEETMPPGKQVALQPALAHVFAQHFHHAAILRQVLVYGPHFGHPLFSRDLVNRIQAIRGRLVRTEHPEVARILG